MKTAFLFPGQGAQHTGMGKGLNDAVDAARQVFEEADQALGIRISNLCFEGPDDELQLTANTQPAILTASVAMLRSLEGRVLPDYVMGHSLGEYSALVAAGSLRFRDALELVRKRGLFMQEAVPPGEGAMAALIGLREEIVGEICAITSEYGVCSPANINSPQQIVIAGRRVAVERAVILAKQRGAKRAVMLAVSAPFHCELMKPAADRLAPLLEDTVFTDLQVGLVTNVDAKLIRGGDEAREALIRQVASPVRWSDSVKMLVGKGVMRFVVVGPGRVLSGLVKQINRETQVFNVEDPESLERTVAAFR